MPNDYSGTKKVRAINGQRWIDDFKRLRLVVVMLPTGIWFEVKKIEVWREARTTRLVYSIMDNLYRSKRSVFVITGGYVPGNE